MSFFNYIEPISDKLSAVISAVEKVEKTSKDTPMASEDKLKAALSLISVVCPGFSQAEAVIEAVLKIYKMLHAVEKASAELEQDSARVLADSALPEQDQFA